MAITIKRTVSEKSLLQSGQVNETQGVSAADTSRIRVCSNGNRTSGKGGAVRVGEQVWSGSNRCGPARTAGAFNRDMSAADVFNDTGQW